MEVAKIPLLEVRSVRKYFGGVRALEDVTLSLDEGNILGLIGPNGSGKTTLFNIILNLIKPDSGEIIFNGRNITALSTFKIVRQGIGRTFQVIKLFNKLTVEENIRIAGLCKNGDRMSREKRVVELLKFVDLTRLAKNRAEELSYGQQKLLELAIALMPDPDLLLLDEPVAGVNPFMIEKFSKYIVDLNAAGKTFLIIEHNIPFTMDIAHEMVVLSEGRVIARGPPTEISRNAAVLEAYLGG